MQRTREKKDAGPTPMVAGIAAAMAVGTPAATLGDAGLPDTPVLDRAEPVADSELAGMRGRFVNGGNVIHFGMQMTSRLQKATGEALRAQLEVSADLDGVQPEVDIEPSVTVEPDPNAATGGDTTASGNDTANNASAATGGTGTGQGQSPDGGTAQPDTAQQTNATAQAGDSTTVETGSAGAETVNGGSAESSGVRQTIQVAGDANEASNEMRIEVTEGPPASELEADGSQRTEVVAETDSGGRVSVAAGEGGAGIEIESPGVGQVSQKVLAGNGLEQLVRLAGDGHGGVNRMTLRVGLGERLDGGAVDGLRRAIRNLDSLP